MLNTCEVRIADINNDGRVDAADLSQLIAGWTTAGPTDLNHDGFTDSGDLTILLADWG